ncbi:MAG: DNA-binding protein, partial [Chloracidobacterium sp.]|nr:DNA-binding protein [Chloracidobacterium sp.]
DGDFQPLLGSDVTLLTSYAVALRYPGDEPDPSVAEARYAVYLAEQIRAMVRAKLSAPDHQP